MCFLAFLLLFQLSEAARGAREQKKTNRETEAIPKISIHREKNRDSKLDTPPLHF